jgi:hypothetical protein
MNPVKSQVRNQAPPKDWHWWNNDWLKYSERNLPSSTLSTTNPTYSALGLNLSLHGKKSASDCQTYGMALTVEEKME